MTSTLKSQNQRRRWLVDAIRTTLIPEFIRRGFEVHLYSKQDGVDRELISSLPFGFLRRSCERGIEQIEIQLDPREYDAAFSLNIGVVPIGGLESLRGHIAAEDVFVTWLDEFFVLYSRPGSSRPFAVRRKWWQTKETSHADYQTLINEVILLIPEVEQVLRLTSIGPHIRRVVIRHP